MIDLDPATQVLLLRFAFIVLLYLFLGAVLFVIWRDLRAPEAEPSVPRRIDAQLLVVDGGTTDLMPGDLLPVRPVTALGRDVANTLIVPDASASAEHALLSYRDGHWWLEDLNSTNGTFLNGAPLEKPAIVGNGDVIGIGRVRLKLQLNGGSASLSDVPYERHSGTVQSLRDYAESGADS